MDSVTIGTVQVAPIPNGNILCKKCGFPEDGWGTKGMYTDMGGFFLWQSGTTKEDTKAEFGYLDIANQYQPCFNFKSDGSAEFSGSVSVNGFTSVKHLGIPYENGIFLGHLRMTIVITFTQMLINIYI